MVTSRVDPTKKFRRLAQKKRKNPRLQRPKHHKGYPQSTDEDPKTYSGPVVGLEAGTPLAHAFRPDFVVAKPPGFFRGR